MSKEELMKLSVKELDSICKEKDLPRYKGKTHLNKSEMVENILWVEDCISEEKTEAVEEEVLAKESSKEKYIKIGQIIAFRDKKDYVRSGKICNITDGNIDVQLKSGRMFRIANQDIIWVTTEENKRWPKSVLIMLKETQKRIEEEYKKRHDISNEDLLVLSKKMMSAGA